MAEEYTANDLERSVLDPLFYRYEKAIRLSVRLEAEKKALSAENHRLTEMARQSVSTNARCAQLESIIETRRVIERTMEPKVKALYDGAKDLIVEIKGARFRKGTKDVVHRLQQAINDICAEVEIPF